MISFHHSDELASPILSGHPPTLQGLICESANASRV
jgi:hypothetical protein